MAGRLHFRKADAGWDMREAEPHEIDQKRGPLIILIIVGKSFLEFHH
jgi:hypothetical protein